MVEAGCLCRIFDRSFPDAPQWMRREPEPNEDMGATAEETRERVERAARGAAGM